MFDKPSKNFNNNQVKIRSQKRLFRLYFFLLFQLLHGDSTYVGNRISKNVNYKIKSDKFLVRCIMCGIVTLRQWFGVTDVVKNPKFYILHVKTLQLPQLYIAMSPSSMLLHQWNWNANMNDVLGHFETNFIFGI